VRSTQAGGRGRGVRSWSARKPRRQGVTKRTHAHAVERMTGWPGPAEQAARACCSERACRRSVRGECRCHPARLERRARDTDEPGPEGQQGCRRSRRRGCRTGRRRLGRHRYRHSDLGHRCGPGYLSTRLACPNHPHTPRSARAARPSARTVEAPPGSSGLLRFWGRPERLPSGDLRETLLLGGCPVTGWRRHGADRGTFS
jgi:hypothetical protein